jgi:hypothetical protein
MRPGRIRVRALRHAEAAVEWEPDAPSAQPGRWWRNLVFDASAGLTRPVLGPSDVVRAWRAASYCDGCGAVLAHPRAGIGPAAE